VGEGFGINIFILGDIEIVRSDFIKDFYDFGLLWGYIKDFYYKLG
jgi:hypothetical protein